MRRLSQSLVIAEIALVFTLLAVSAALIGHLRTLARTSPGFEADHVLTFSVGLADSIASDDAKRVLYQKRLVDAVSAIPGVDVTGFANRLPLTGCCLSVTISRDGHPIESRAVERTSYVVADPGFFRAMKIPPPRPLPHRSGHKRGSAARRSQPGRGDECWAGENPIDGFGRFGGATGTRFQVVGVVGDVRSNGLGNATVPEIYLSNTVASTAVMRFAVRSPLSAERLVPDVRRAIRGVDPALPIHEVLTMDEIVRDSLALERVGSLMTTFFALAALLMATLGVYGVVSCRGAATHRRNRHAHGARRRRPRRALARPRRRSENGGRGRRARRRRNGRGRRAGRAIPRAQGVGWLPFAIAAAIVALVTTAATSFPAWRAARLSPMAAIRDT